MLPALCAFKMLRKNNYVNNDFSETEIYMSLRLGTNAFTKHIRE